MQYHVAIIVVVVNCDTGYCECGTAIRRAGVYIRLQSKRWARGPSDYPSFPNSLDPFASPPFYECWRFATETELSSRYYYDITNTARGNLLTLVSSSFTFHSYSVNVSRSLLSSPPLPLRRRNSRPVIRGSFITPRKPAQRTSDTLPTPLLTENFSDTLSQATASRTTETENERRKLKLVTPPNRRCRAAGTRQPTTCCSVIHTTVK